MKSSGNTLLLVGLFVLIVVIIALIVYYTRPGETKTSEQTSTKLTVENLIFERTLNPDSSVGDGVSGYTIEPYGIEYAGSADYVELSKNVTFTMKWNNAPGFSGIVKGFKIEHYVDDAKKHTYTYENALALDTANNAKKELISFNDFGECKVKLSSVAWDPKGSVVGQNKFKLLAIRVDETADNLLYDGTKKEPGENTFPAELKISESQLSVTLSMTSPQTVTFTPDTIDGASTRAVISKTAYDISNKHTSLMKNGTGIYLETVKDSGGENYYFQYEDGQYLLNDLSKGAPTNAKPKFKVEIVNKGDNTSKGQIKEADGTKYLSSSTNGVLRLYETNDKDLTEEIFKGFEWTFNERISKSLVPGTSFKAIDENRKFGYVVCVSGDDAFVGQPDGVSIYGNGGQFTESGGIVHIYKRNSAGVWEFKKSINSSISGLDPKSGTEFGCSIAISGDYAVIGQRKFTRGNSKQIGRIYIIKKDAEGNWETSWRSEKRPLKLEPPANATEYQGAHYGTSVAMSGKFIVVGAPGSARADGTSQYEFGKNYKGTVYLYKIPNTSHKTSRDGFIEERGTVTGRVAGERFGHSVDITEHISGNRVIVGAPSKGGVHPDTDRGDDWDGACNVNLNKPQPWCPNSGYENGKKTGSVSIYKMTRDSTTQKEQLSLEREMNPSSNSWDKFVPSEGLRFGESVAIDGMIAVIGVPGMLGSKKNTAERQYDVANSVADPDRPNTGGIFVLKGDGDRKTDSPSNPVWVNRWSLMFGECVFDGTGVNPKNNRVVNTPTIPNPQKDGKFGSSVSISDGEICVGQPGGNGGSVCVFKYKLDGPTGNSIFYGRSSPTTYSKPPAESRIILELARTIQSPTNTNNGKFGLSVSNSGGYAMIGEPNAQQYSGSYVGKKNVGSAFITAI